jgi:hypothetical protein
MADSSILATGATYENSLLFQAIETNNVRPFVVSRNADFNELHTIYDTVAGRVSQPMQSGARELKMPWLPNLAVYGIIKTGGRTAVGNQLKLEFTNATADTFMNYRAVESSNGTFGKVVSHGPGYIVVSLLYSQSGDTTFQTGDFAAGTQVSENQDVSPGVTGGRESREFVPQIDTNVIGQQRYTLELTREDVSRKTVVTVDGKPYWQHAAQPLFMRETKNSINKGVWSAPKVTTNNEITSGGTKWQIENMGGQIETYNGDFTQDTLIQIAKNARARGTGTKEFLVLNGFNVLAGFQKNVASAYIQYAGIDNTIGGKEVKGINAEHFKVLGISFKFVNFTLLDFAAVNPQGNSTLTGELKSSYTAVFLDTSEVPTVDHGVQPFVSCYSYGQDSYNMQIIEGMTDLLGRNAKNANNDKNACSVQIEINEMYQLNDPSRHILLQIEA